MMEYLYSIKKPDNPYWLRHILYYDGKVYATIFMNNNNPGIKIEKNFLHIGNVSLNPMKVEYVNKTYRESGLEFELKEPVYMGDDISTNLIESRILYAIARKI